MSVRIAAPSDAEPVTVADLIGSFHAAGKPRDQFRVGVEFERFAVERRTGRHLRYDEPGGIRDLLAGLASKHDWQPFVNQRGHLTALERNGATVSIEPGGQVEFATAPLRTLADVARDRACHCRELSDVAGPDVAFLTAGVAPLADLHELPLMPRARHAIMAEFLPRRSPTALWMMKGTASVQAAFDFTDEADACRKLRVALTLSPMVNALWGNSPVCGGRDTGHASHRGHVWAGMDPARSGLLVELLAEELSFRCWTDYLLDVPLMVTHIGGKYQPAACATFREFVQRGADGYFPTLADWEMQITTVFPEVRLKRFLEVRGADAVPAALALGVAGFWKGILYSDDALTAAEAVTATLPPHELPALFDHAYRKGLAGEHRGRRLLDWNRELVSIAASGLPAEERPFLDPLWELLERGRSPGEEFRARGINPVDAASVVASFEDALPL